MTTKDLANHLPPRWREDFERFVETGEASDLFLEYLDEDETGQATVEAAFSAQASAFDRLAAHLQQPEPVAAEATASPTATRVLDAALSGYGIPEYVEKVSADLAQSVAAVTGLSEPERRIATAAAADALREQNRTTDAHDVLADLERDLEKVY